jgi:DNA-binding NarL/FixJ family response regulator
MKDRTFLLVDDHPIVLKGLISEFKENGYTNILTASNGIEALQIITDQQPDFTLLDIDMPYLNGLEVAERVKDLNTKIIILTQHKEDGFLHKIKSIGADGYLLKEDDFAEIEKAIHAINDGNFYLSSSFNAILLVKMNHKLKLIKNLSATELKILHYISEHFTTTEIADKMYISPRTVDKHRSNIISKLELPSKKESLNDFIKENKLLLESL